MTPTRNRTNLTGREYQRVSKDASGREGSNDEQHDDNVAAAAEEGITLTGTPYRDTARASRTSKARRADFDQLLADLRAGTFDADVLVMWESSRGSRRVSDWVLLLELLEDNAKRIFVTTHRRLYDPTNPRDRRTLLEDAVDSEYESGKSGLRIKRSMAANAENGGRHGGRRAFGYKGAGGAIEPVEAEHVRDATRRVLAGESTRSIAADWNRRGITTSAGNAWHPGPLRNLLAGTRIAGIRTHKGRAVAKGAWPAIITEDDHQRLVATLANRTPTGRRGRTAWLLTGLLRCGRCGATLVGNTDATGGRAPGTRRYMCRKAPGYSGCGGLGIKAEPLEQVLGILVTERLADLEAHRDAAAPDDSPELAELNRIAAARLELADDYAAGAISRETRLEDAAALDRLQHTIETRLAGKVRENIPFDLIATDGNKGRTWDELEHDDQHRRLHALIETIAVAPASRRGSTAFEPERVTAPGRITWKI